MKFRYAPAGADPQEWEYEPGKLMSPEAEAIERHTGLTFPEWINAVGKGSMLAIHGLLFVLLKRENPTLKWDQVQFAFDDYDFVYDATETAHAIAKLEAQPELTDDEADMLEALREAQAEDDEAPKYADLPELTEPPSTPGSSPTTSESDPGSTTD